MKSLLAGCVAHGAVLALLFLFFLAPSVRAIDGPVRVILWFDTEDYLLPADDDAALRLAQMLSARDIHATFKMVGEKARVLEKRGRRDVIDALKKHDIGYHANFHSVHPTPTEYLADCGWLDGVAEFARREGGGAADVCRIFGVETLACYGQPGSSWGSQAIGALKQIGVAPHGVACYVDEGTHIGLDEKPFWYAAALNVYHMGQNYTRMELHDPAAVAPAEKKVTAIAGRLRSGGGGLISIFYHPCEWVHKEFWDGVNFKRGANPPREEWKAPPQRPAAETDAAFQRFGDYIDHIRAIPGLTFVTASDLPLLYPDETVSKGASELELAQLAKKIVASAPDEINFQIVNGKSFSPADQFELLTRAVGDWIDSKKIHFPIRATRVLGPDNLPPVSQTANYPWPAFRDATLGARDFLDKEHRIPARVFIGAEAVAPADFLAALARIFEGLRSGQETPASVSVGTGGALATVRRVAADTPGLFGGWVIHKENFRAPKVMEIARLQAWTLKPALPAAEK